MSKPSWITFAVMAGSYCDVWGPFAPPYREGSCAANPTKNKRKKWQKMKRNSYHTSPKKARKAKARGQL